MKDTESQRLGFEFEKDGRSYDEYRHSRQTSKIKLQEVTIAQAKKQLLATNRISKILGVIGGGKEATVLIAQENETEEYVCAKVFRYFTSTIRKRLRGTHHLLESDMANIAAKQEYWNLVEMYDAQVPVPRPKELLGNILVMDLITSNGQSNAPAPLLRDVDLTISHDPEEILYESLDILASLFLRAHFIHGDYSEHNLMVTEPGSHTTESGIVTMDVSQSVKYNQKTFIDTPIRIRLDRAVHLLEIDINNLNQHFKKRYRLCVDPVEVREEIINELPLKLQGFYEKSTEMRPDSPYSREMNFAKEILREERYHQRTGTIPQKRRW